MVLKINRVSFQIQTILLRYVALQRLKKIQFIVAPKIFEDTSRWMTHCRSRNVSVEMFAKPEYSV